ncbi:GntR family transcriptional regulator [Paracoccus sp. Z330]|uniref:GntR family transcriptional regulator n=1 Tax=Paracoccus onchidii TaxID=3017813 RepID=A0ABT4ZGC9_9RHOB|nr:GntR family transcriptional regulator [Paracoccus onchidii]MDB6178423.1 GntR family transcriptional regulator [Paracoccus onchidii]
MSLKDLLDDDISAERPMSLAEQSADKLRQLILLEKLPPGLALNERDLSDLLGISRTPVRDAIRLLETEGLVDYSETRRPRVANPSLETLSHWLSVQGALEGLAGELACQHASDAELARIVQLQDEMVGCVDSDDAMKRFELDMSFHSSIVAAAHNPPLSETHRQYNTRLWRARFISSQLQTNRERQTRKHKAIVDALLARDAKVASQALIAHLKNAIVNIEVAMSQRAREAI